MPATETPAAPAADTVKASWKGTVADKPSPMVDEFLQDAKALAAEKVSLLERINANREILRNLRTSGKCNQAQADAVSAFYADREHKRAAK